MLHLLEMMHVTDNSPNLKNAEHVGRCCKRQPQYLIEYAVFDTKYRVCSECVKIPQWVVGIKQKVSLC